jgi:hypothetical protein
MTIKTANWITVLFLAGVFAFVGCGKSAKSTAPTDAARMNVVAFKQAFPSPTPEQQSTVFKVTNGVRYRIYPDALEALEKLASDPTLTEPQKKAVADMTQAVKQAMANAPTEPAQ